MRLYHGSNHIVSSPEFGKGKKYNDYGQGFYCTESIDMAMEWAVAENKSGFVNCYDIEDKKLSVLDLNSDRYNTLHWITVLLQHRTFDVDSALAEEAKAYLTAHYNIDLSPFDLVRGYRADDSYFSFALDFLNGTISYRQLTNAMHLGKLGEQIMVKSQKAFDSLRYQGYEIADHEKYYRKRQERDRNARRQYFDSERNQRRKDDLYIIHILDQEVKPDDSRL